MADVRQYKFVRLLGKGGFAEVFEYTDTTTGQAVAIKQIFEGDRRIGVNLGAIKEIQVMLEVQHPNIIRLFEVFPVGGRVYMVLEKAATDLDKLIRLKTVYLSDSRIKAILKMILEGLAYCHEMWFMHRDLKPENILITADGVAKLGDFGHATTLPDEGRVLHPTVVTRWYRPPELLLGASRYSEKVDMWSVGCIFAEMYLGAPLFCDKDDRGDGDGEPERIRQLVQVFRLLGTPTPKSWPGAELLPGFVSFTPTPAADFASVFPTIEPAARELLSRLLTLDPVVRISSREALEHAYFTADPKPASTEELAALIAPKI